MRYILTLTIGLLAAIGASATTASAHDYHRSHHAVEVKHSRAHHIQKHRWAHKRADYRQRSRRDIHHRQSLGRHSQIDHRSRYVIVLIAGLGAL
jgi:hypothetical protein